MGLVCSIAIAGGCRRHVPVLPHLSCSLGLRSSASAVLLLPPDHRVCSRASQMQNLGLVSAAPPSLVLPWPIPPHPWRLLSDTASARQRCPGLPSPSFRLLPLYAQGPSPWLRHSTRPNNPLCSRLSILACQEFSEGGNLVFCLLSPQLLQFLTHSRCSHSVCSAV